MAGEVAEREDTTYNAGTYIDRIYMQTGKQVQINARIGPFPVGSQARRAAGQSGTERGGLETAEWKPGLTHRHPTGTERMKGTDESETESSLF